MARHSAKVVYALAFILGAVALKWGFPTIAFLGMSVVGLTLAEGVDELKSRRPLPTDPSQE